MGGPQRLLARGKDEMTDTQILCPGSREVTTLHTHFLPPQSRGSLSFVLPPQSLAGVKVETQRKCNSVRMQLLRKDRLPLSP